MYSLFCKVAIKGDFGLKFRRVRMLDTSTTWYQGCLDKIMLLGHFEGFFLDPHAKIQSYAEAFLPYRWQLP